jgi:mRNA degradation ribonuclease J1/J2
MPIYGFPHMIMGNAKNAVKLGYSEDKIIIGKNGQVIEFTKENFTVTPYYVPHRLMSVDGYTIGMSKEEHMHDRYQMQVSGSMVVSIAKKGTQYLIRMEKAGLPDFSNFPKLEPRINEFLEQILRSDLSRFKDVDAFKAHLSRKVSDIVHEEIGKEPVVMVVLH